MSCGIIRAMKTTTTKLTPQQFKDNAILDRLTMDTKCAFIEFTRYHAVEVRVGVIISNWSYSANNELDNDKLISRLKSAKDDRSQAQSHFQECFSAMVYWAAEKDIHLTEWGKFTAKCESPDLLI